jgi:hypothetical protein
MYISAEISSNEMIKVKHPNEDNNLKQEEQLALLTGENKMLFSIMFSHGNASYRYYNQDIQPTIQDYEEWLTGLSDTLRTNMTTLGFEECRNMLSLRRYVIEKNDIGMEEFVKNLMGEEDYNYYLSLAQR